MADGQKVTFSGEGDQEPGLEPGDIIIVLDEKEHPNFKRSGTGNHLIKNPTISKKFEFSRQKKVCIFHHLLEPVCYKKKQKKSKPRNWFGEIGDL